METPVQTDLDLLDNELAMAERHVVEARRHVLQQRDIVVKLALAKQDCAAARRLLSLFEEMHALCLLGDRDSLLARRLARWASSPKAPQ